MLRPPLAVLLLVPALIPVIFLVPVHAAQNEKILTVTVLPAAPGHLTDLAPGDRTEWAAQVTNTSQDTVPLYATFSTTGTESLVTDPEDGLQLNVALCPDPLESTTVDGGAIVYTCPAETIPLGAGSAAELGPLEATTALAPGDTVGIRARVVLSATAGNAFENTAGQLHARFATTGTDAGQPGQPAPTTPPPLTPPDDGPDNGSDDGSDGAGAGGHGPSPDHPPVTAEDLMTPGATDSDRTGAWFGSDTGTNGWSAPDDGLAHTGRNILAALIGGGLTAGVGLLLLGAAQRRSRTEETGL